MDRRFWLGFALGAYSLYMVMNSTYKSMQMTLEAKDELIQVCKDVADLNKKAVMEFVQRCDPEISQEILRLMEFDSVLLGYDVLTAEDPDRPPQK